MIIAVILGQPQTFEYSFKDAASCEAAMNKIKAVIVAANTKDTFVIGGACIKDAEPAGEHHHGVGRPPMRQ